MVDTRRCRYLVRFLLEAFESNGDVIRSFVQAREVHYAALAAVEPFPKVLRPMCLKHLSKLSTVRRGRRSMIFRARAQGGDGDGVRWGGVGWGLV